MAKNWITASWRTRQRCFSHSFTFRLMSAASAGLIRMSHVWYNWRIKYMFLITSSKKQHILFMLKQERSPPPFFFHGCSLRLQLCVTHLISANYTQAQSLIQAVDIEQPAVVNYFFTILPGKAAQTSVKQRSVSLKSIHPGPLSSNKPYDFHHYNRHALIILFSWCGHDWHSGSELRFPFPWNTKWMEWCYYTQYRIHSGFSCKRKRSFLCCQ